MQQPQDPAADLIDAARSALRKRQPLAAVAQLRLALTHNPRDTEAAELLGVAHSLAGNRAGALEAFRLATELEPGRATAHYNYALILSQDKNDLDDAVQENQTALLINPGYVQALALQEALRKKIQERAWRTDEDFAVVDAGVVDPRRQTNGAFAKLQCPICGGMNFATSRTCARCGSLIPELDEIIPVE